MKNLDYAEIPWVDHPDCEYSGPAVDVDYGIGDNEYWGRRTIHHDYRWVCPVCERDVEP